MISWDVEVGGVDADAAGAAGAAAAAGGGGAGAGCGELCYHWRRHPQSCHDEESVHLIPWKRKSCKDCLDIFLMILSWMKIKWLEFYHLILHVTFDQYKYNMIHHYVGSHDFQDNVCELEMDIDFEFLKQHHQLTYEVDLCSILPCSGLVPIILACCCRCCCCCSQPSSTIYPMMTWKEELHHT